MWKFHYKFKTDNVCSYDESKKKFGTQKRLNPCSPEGFSQTYFPKGGLLDYQYWRSYNPKFTTSV